jgi:hypothetical protein
MGKYNKRLEFAHNRRNSGIGSGHNRGNRDMAGDFEMIPTTTITSKTI